MKNMPERSREELLRALLDIASDLTALRDQGAVLQTITRRTRRLIDCDMAYISLTDFEQHLTTIEQADGVFTHAYRTLVQPLGTGVLGQVAVGLAPYQTADYLADPNFEHVPEIDEIVRREGARAIMGVPLRIGGRVMGALVVAERRPRVFRPEEIDLVDSIGKQAAVALDNSMRFDQVTALVESLSGAQQRTAAEMSVISRMLDLDARLMDAVMVEPNVRRILELGRSALGTELWFTDPYGAVVSSDEAGASPPDHVIRTPVLAAGQQLGEVSVVAEVADRDHDLIERVAVHLALAILFLRAEKDADLRRQSLLLEDILEGRATSLGRTEMLLQRWDIYPGDPLWCVVVATPAHESRGLLQNVQSLIPHSIMMAHEDHICMITGDAGWEIRLRSLFSRRGWRFQAGVCGPSSDADRLPEAHRSAKFALGSLLMTDAAGTADSADLGVVGAVLELARQGELPQQLTAAIEPLAAYDEARGTELLRTAFLALETDGDLTRTAALLGVHRNTVRQRLGRISQLLGTSWDRSPRRLEVHLALHAHAARSGLDWSSRRGPSAPTGIRAQRTSTR